VKLPARYDDRSKEISMKRGLTVFAILFALVVAGLKLAQNAPTPTRNLEIYWIDVEGGASTLFISPTGESLLFDTGFPGNGDRDAKRIYAAAQKAGLRQIDHVVISHWHADHEGGLGALSKMIPIRHFYDHGNGVEEADRSRLEEYKTIAGNNRTILKAGDSIPLGAVQVRVLVSEGPVIASPVNGGGPNPLCANHAQMTPAGPENQRMVGLSLTYGNFKLASLGDLDWQRELELACPVNKLGPVTVYTINRHGGLDNSGTPAVLGAIRPQVIVVNNGPRKGMGATDDRVKPLTTPGAPPAPYERNAYLRMAKTPGVIDIWQAHLSLIDSDPAHNSARDMIANLEEGTADQGHWIHALVRPDGSYTISNGRNAFNKTYRAADNVQPVNSGANPYRTIRNWGTLPAGRPWGAANGVAIDRDGKSVWVADRCGTTAGCVGSKVDPIQKFDENGNRLTSFGGDMFVWPHGVHVDRDGNIWVADARRLTPEELKMFPEEKNKGSIVVKFSPQGKVLMTLGKPGVAGNPPEALTDPTNVLTDVNGDVYVAESHTNVLDPNLVGRISVFDKNGKFIRSIGKTGTGPGEFRTPHALVFDSQGRLIVADRHNHRIQILDKNGKFIGELKNFSRVSGLAIDKNDTIYAADSESAPQTHPGWSRGIRIGSLKDGKVTIFIPGHQTEAPEGAMGEGIAIDAAGNLYTAEALVKGVTKYVRAQ